MAQVNFTQFDLKQRVDLKSGDFVVGYKNDGTEEFRTTLNSLTGAVTTIQGLQGRQGTQGIRGEQGTQGIRGAFDAQGVQGLQGRQGTQGVGSQGISGEFAGQGTQGLQGVLGNQGSQGLSNQGVQGLSNQGVQGQTGFQGLQGTQGTQGRQGLQGLQGPVGVAINIVATQPLTQGIETSELNALLPLALPGQGVINSNNGHLWVNNGPGVWFDYGRIVGNQGIQGLQSTGGSQGSQGTFGLQGSQGLQGFANQGSQGVQGSQGLQGFANQGSQGIQGLQGNQGIQGLQGNQGLQGLQGFANQGVQGRAVQGLQGVIGSAPANPVIRATRLNASQTIPDNSETTFIFDLTPEYNTNSSLFSLERNSGSTLSKIRIAAGGVYLVNFKLNCSNYSYDDFLRIAVYTNGTSVDTSAALYQYMIQARTAANGATSDTAVYSGSTTLFISEGAAPIWVSVAWYRETSPQPASISGTTVISPVAYAPFLEIIKLS